mgnify:CR=1 FL=1
MTWRWDELEEMDRRRYEAWEQALLSDERARERSMLDDEERRLDGFFDRDRELADEGDDGDWL